MHKANAAERILEMATTSSSAASTIGDLLEESSQRTVFWFWLSVLRILAVHIWQDLNQCKMKMAWIVFVTFFDFVILSFVLGGIISFFDAVFLKSLFIPNWIVDALSVTVWFLVGWDTARRSEGRELAICIALTSLMAVIRFMIFRSVSLPLIFIWLCVMAGAVFFRYRVNMRYRKV